MVFSQFITNDTEKTFVYEKDGLRFNLSKLSAAGSYPECLRISTYKEDGEPIAEIQFLGEEEKDLLRKWLEL